jgi:hypothetical protein
VTWMCANTVCALPLRRASVPVSQAPGTQQHAADGLCKRCYNKRRAQAEVLTPQQLQNARNALNGYLKARQTRLTRSKGAHPWITTISKRTDLAVTTKRPGALARRGATTHDTRNQPTPTAHNTGTERNALELQM